MPEKRWTSTLASMAQWARSAHRAGVPVALTGLRGRCWKHPEVGSLLSDKVLHETWFALCGLPTEHDRLKSGEVWHAYLSVRLPPRGCRCPHNSPHQPRSVDSAERRRATLELTGQAYQTHLPTIVLALAGKVRPGSSGEPASSRRPDSNTSNTSHPQNLSDQRDATEVNVCLLYTSPSPRD